MPPCCTGWTGPCWPVSPGWADIWTGVEDLWQKDPLEALILLATFKAEPIPRSQGFASCCTGPPKSIRSPIVSLLQGIVYG